tara:strand:- start:49 stop:1941 length:1893 start_codon:yes stop_codon:yes gene_type:complete
MSEVAVGAVSQLQNRVGASFAGVSSLLAPPERAGALLQAGATAQGTGILIGVRDVQQEMLYCLQEIKSVLKNTLQIEEDRDRRAAEQLAENLKEGNNRPVVGGGDVGDIELTDEEEQGGSLFGGFGTALAAWVGAGGIKKLAKGFGLRFLKGGAVFMLADLLDDEIAKIIPEGEFQDFVANDAKWIALGAAVAGLPGAIAAFGIVGVNGVVDYLTGKNDELALTDIGGIVVAGAMAAKFGLTPLLTKFGITGGATLLAGTALLPVVVATGAAIALGIGAKYLADKNDEYQQKILDSLGKLTALTDEELTKRFARAEETFLEQLGMGGIFGTEQSELGDAEGATQKAVKNVEDDKQLTTTEQKNLIDLADATLSISDEDLKILLADQSKTKNLLRIVNNLQTLAAKGELGPDGKRVLSNMLMFADRLQNVARDIEADTGATSMTQGIIKGQSGYMGGDLLEKIADSEADLVMKKQRVIEAQAKVDKVLAKIAAEGKTEEDLGFFSGERSQLRVLRGLVEQAQRQVDITEAKFQENALKNTFNRNQDIGFTLTDLQKIFTPDELKVLIEKSMTNKGASAIVPPEKKEFDGQMVIGSGNSATNQTKVDNGTVNIGTLKTYIDDDGVRRVVGGL